VDGPKTPGQMVRGNRSDAIHAADDSPKRGESRESRVESRGSEAGVVGREHPFWGLPSPGRSVCYPCLSAAGAAFIEAEKKKSTTIPNLQPPLPDNVVR
jgi:hypothetical protein